MPPQGKLLWLGSGKSLDDLDNGAHNLNRNEATEHVSYYLRVLLVGVVQTSSQGVG